MSEPFQPTQYAREQLLRFAHQQAEKFDSQTNEMDEVSVGRAKELARAFRAVARELNASHYEGRNKL